MTYKCFCSEICLPKHTADFCPECLAIRLER
nr:MAG TPA: TniQ [Caudoviricetes sp.]